MRIFMMLGVLGAVACVVDSGRNDGLFDCEVEGGCGPAMRRGENCTRCHREGAVGPSVVPALPFGAGGTIYHSASASFDDDGVEGVEVTFVDANGKSVVATSNAWGNIYTETPLVFPLQLITLRRDGSELTMPLSPGAPSTPPYPPPDGSEVHHTYYAPAGSCNACHTLPPLVGAPGRIYAP